MDQLNIVIRPADKDARCPACHQPITVGERIARPPRSNARWVHADCLVTSHAA